nr:hypothetical protein BVC80_8955g48 [Ipomoea batatas]
MFSKSAESGADDEEDGGHENGGAAAEQVTSLGCAEAGHKRRHSMLVLTANANPAVLVSSGKTSLGISQHRGPHDQAKAITYKQTRITTTVDRVLSRDPVVFKLVARIMPIATYLISKADTKTKEDATQDESPFMFSKSAESGADDEEDGCHEDGGSAAEQVTSLGCTEAGHKRRHVQR